MAPLEGEFLNRNKHAAGMIEVESMVREYLDRGVLPETSSVLHTRSWGRGGLLRLVTSEFGEVVAKVSVDPGAKGRIKRRIGLSNTQHEWRMHRLLLAADVQIPKPLGYLSFGSGQQTVEVLTVTYIGEVTRGLVFLKSCLASGSDLRITQFEQEVIAMTKAMVTARVLDMDHQLNNIVVSSQGKVFRLDLECARHWWFRPLPHRAYGETIGRLVSSHAFAFQPELHRTEDFAVRLAGTLSPPGAVLSHARDVIADSMARQKSTSGIDSRLRLDW